MPKTYTRVLHIFRRDLRLEDNTALIEALNLANEVIPCFIFDKRQIEQNDYKSDNAIEFMLHSLADLDAALKKKNSQLYFFYGIAEDVIAKLFQETQAQAVFINRDYTPFSRNRDHAIATLCEKNRIDFQCYADALLHEPEQVLKDNGKPYTVYTPYFRKASQFHVDTPKKNSHSNYFRGEIKTANSHYLSKLIAKHNTNILLTGGRKEALNLLKKATTLKDYKLERDIPALNATSLLSSHNKFGTVSIREVYSAIVEHLGKSHTLINELYWRDFFTQIGFYFPHVFKGAFHQHYDHIAWSNNEKHFRAWCEGRTGFPIVDAGMRELNTTGYMHNRVRMIVASFLTKDLHINWQWGEKYFAQKLIDYDPAVNNGNWQWAASTGCDAQPYFRIFNPWLQQQKYDPDCLYIKRWIPELNMLPAKIIHNLSSQTSLLMTNYPTPMVDHAIASQQAKLLYKTRHNSG